MELPEHLEPPDPQPSSVPAAPTLAPSPQGHGSLGFTPQTGDGSCSCGAPGETCSCGGSPDGMGMTAPAYVYAVGRVEPRFPSLALEKEFAQATGRAETAGLTDRQAVHAVLAQRANRYLARQLCYVLTIEGLETYLLQPRDPADLELLIDAVRPTPRPTGVDVAIGVRGPLAPPELCNGLMVPIVVFNQLYSFDIDALVRGIPRPEQIPEAQFGVTAEELFMRIMQLADNAGATDEHRALNYLAVRYPAIYATAAERHAQNASLTAVEVRLNHAQVIVACDFCVVVTATLRTLYVFVVMEHATRKILHVNVTGHPTAAWTLQQLRAAIPADHAYRFLIQDRDSIFSQQLDQRVRHLGLRVLKTLMRSPQANALCERLLGTLRRECLDFLIPLTEYHVRHLRHDWTPHYNTGRPHMALGPGIPQSPPHVPAPRHAHRHRLPAHLQVADRPILGGLHHEYRLETKVA